MYSTLRTSYKIVPVTKLNKYSYNGKSEIKVNINNSSEKFLKKKLCSQLLINTSSLTRPLREMYCIRSWQAIWHTDKIREKILIVLPFAVQQDTQSVLMSEFIQHLC